ncbi:MAG: hypothetical protein C0507_03810 [Cyanobacteria bacterium PR.3.49]|nr:hypothetical protein [Cyanobacteria bacterium PR.3.49]
MLKNKTGVEPTAKEKNLDETAKENAIVTEKLHEEVGATIPKYGPDGRLASTRVLREGGYDEVSFSYHPDGRRKSVKSVEVRGSSTTSSMEEYSPRGELIVSESTERHGNNWSRKRMQLDGDMRVLQNESVVNGQRTTNSLSFNRRTGEWTEKIDTPTFKAITTGDAMPGDYLTQTARENSVIKSKTIELANGMRTEREFRYNGVGNIAWSAAETFDAAGNRRDEDLDLHFTNIFEGLLNGFKPPQQTPWGF